MFCKKMDVENLRRKKVHKGKKEQFFNGKELIFQEKLLIFKENCKEKCIGKIAQQGL